jgi:hypothetical protein
MLYRIIGLVRRSELVLQRHSVKHVYYKYIKKVLHLSMNCSNSTLFKLGTSSNRAFLVSED